MDLQYLRNNFLYHTDGHLFWTGPFHGRWSWSLKKPVGQVGKLGYRIVRFRGKAILLHRLIWRHHNGDIPQGMVIDHINGNPSDNRIENLRCVTRTENQRNMKLHKHNKSGRVGVCFVTKEQKWLAHITVANRFKNLGYFSNFDDACRARAQKERELGFHINHGRNAIQ